MEGRRARSLKNGPVNALRLHRNRWPALSHNAIFLFDCLNGFVKDVHLEWLPDDHAANFTDEINDFFVVARAGHENEFFAELRFDAFDGFVKHVTSEIRHEHVAKDDGVIFGDDMANALDAVLNMHDVVIPGPEILADDAGKIEIIFENQRFGIGHTTAARKIIKVMRSLRKRLGSRHLCLSFHFKYFVCCNFAKLLIANCLPMSGRFEVFLQRR
jgi:hypothetical protein